jgi:lipoprotein-anchoring transpeptidase ErfK/SrfK
VTLVAASVSALAVGGAVGLWPVDAPPTPAGKVSATVAAADTVRAPATGSAAAVRPGFVALPEPTRVESRTTQQNLEDVPTRSGEGRRVVFDMSAQRVWLVRRDGSVQRTYLVSGSRHDNLKPGHYVVYSTSRYATAFDYSSTMQYFVRFTRGDTAAIGFHDIPVDHGGRLVQSTHQLGRALSSGCIRQQRADAKAMWHFARVGTRVVVLA